MKIHLHAVCWNDGFILEYFFRHYHWVDHFVIDDDGSTELAVGAFDDPMLAAPVVQFNRRDRLPLFDTLAALPPQPDADKELAHNATVVSHQHPDHDTETWPPREGFAA